MAERLLLKIRSQVSYKHIHYPFSNSVFWYSIFPDARPDFSAQSERLPPSSIQERN